MVDAADGAGATAAPAAGAPAARDVARPILGLTGMICFLLWSVWLCLFCEWVHSRR